MDKENLTWFLQNLARQLALIPTKELEAYVQNASDADGKFHAIGSLLDPTYYRAVTRNGEYDHAKKQLEIVEKLLEARWMIDELEVLAADIRNRQQGQG